MNKKLHLMQGLHIGGSYRVSGNGFPLMLVHGFPLDSTIWQSQVHDLENAFRLIVPDLPGSGDSPPSPASASIEGMAGFLKDVLAQQEITRCVMIGHSMGGYITLAFAEKYPDLLQGFGLLHAGTWPDSKEKISSRRQSIDLIRKNGSGAFIRNTLPGLFTARFRNDHPEEVEALTAHASSLDAEILVSYNQAMMERPDRTELLGKSAVPVLFIAGRMDLISPPDLVMALARLPRVSSFHVLEEAAHMGMLEAPGELSRVVADFTGFCMNHTFA